MKFEEFNARWSEPVRRKGQRVRAAREAWQDWQEEDSEHNRDYEASVRHELGVEFDAATAWFLDEINASPDVVGRGEPQEFFRPRNGKWPPLLLAFALGSSADPVCGSWAGLASSTALARALGIVCSARAKHGNPTQNLPAESARARGFEALATLGIKASGAGLDATTRSMVQRASPMMVMLAVDELSAQVGAAVERRLRAMGFEDGYPEPAGISQQPKEAWPHRSLWMPFSGRIWNLGALAAAGLNGSQACAKWGEACRLGAQDALGPLAHWASFSVPDSRMGNEEWVLRSARALFGEPAVKKERQELLRAVFAGHSARKEPANANDAQDAEKAQGVNEIQPARRGRRI